MMIWFGFNQLCNPLSYVVGYTKMKSTIKWKGSVWDQVSGYSIWTNLYYIHWLYVGPLPFLFTQPMPMASEQILSVQLKKDKVLGDVYMEYECTAPKWNASALKHL